MRERFLCGFTAALLVTAVACGGSAPKPTEAPGAPAAPIATGPLEEGPPPDLSPVAAPADLFGVGRLNRPGQLVDVLLNWSKLPIDWRRELSNEAPGVENVIDLNAPIDLAMALPKGSRAKDLDEPRVVVSFGLRSMPLALEFAKRRSGRVERVAPGIYRVGGSDDCVIAAAAGTPPARLVCGDSPEDIEALLPYATRGLPRESFGPADLHFELRAAPIRARFGKDLRQIRLGLPFLLRSFALDIPRVDRAVLKATSGLADEVVALVEDTDRAVFDLSLKTDSETIESAFDLRFTGKSSWSVQTMAEAGSRAAPPPDAFWRLPKDANVGSFTGPMNVERYAAIRGVVTDLLDGLLEHEKVSRRVRDQVKSLIEDTGTIQAASVYARGDVAPVEPAAKGGVSDRGVPQMEQLRRSLGWYVVGVEDKSDRYKTYLNRIVALYNDRDLRRLLEKRADVKQSKLPILRARAARGAGLAPGSSAFELVLPAALFEDRVYLEPPPSRPGQPRPKAAPKPPPGRPLSVVLILVPDGPRTWLGISADEKTLVEKLGVALKGTPATTLASREGLASLRTARCVGGGFWSLASITSSLDSPLSMSNDSSLAELRRRLFTMPHQGQTPMPYTLNVTSGSTTNVVWALKVPRAVAEDIGALIPIMGGGRHGSPPLPPGPLTP